MERKDQGYSYQGYERTPPQQPRNDSGDIRRAQRMNQDERIPVRMMTYQIVM